MPVACAVVGGLDGLVELEDARVDGAEPRLESGAVGALDLILAPQSGRDAAAPILQALQLPATENLEIEPIEVDMSGLALTTTSPQEIYAIALSNQPEIRAAENRQEGSRYGLQAAKGGLYPRISVSGNITTQYSSIGADQTFVTGEFEEIETGYLQSDPSQKVISLVPTNQVIVSEIPFMDQIDFNRRENISINLNIPIFNNYQARSQVGLAKIERRNADLELIQAKNQLRTSIEQSYADARAAAKRYAALEKQVEALELAFRNAETRRDVGAISTYDYTFAKNNLDQARAELSQAKYTYVFRLKVLDFYLGNPLSFE
ncbi:MAG: TolC family protein [Bacteroidetes bacterium]|nr:TolC family protein [Bacteroidota bacterium]